MTAVAPDDAPLNRNLHLGLVVIAAVTTLGAVTDLPGVFVADYNEGTAPLRIAQVLVAVKLVLAPIIAGAALYFAVKVRLRAATLALAALLLVNWLLDDVPSMAIHGPDLALNFAGFAVGAREFAFPLLGLAGGLLAWGDRSPGLAGLLVCLPTLINWVGFLIFASAILVNGF
jgi:hypothetical protein